jgi:hypothetical protein
MFRGGDGRFFMISQSDSLRLSNINLEGSGGQVPINTTDIPSVSRFVTWNFLIDIPVKFMHLEGRLFLL